jgi:hypothetical protein
MLPLPHKYLNPQPNDLSEAITAIKGRADSRGLFNRLEGVALVQHYVSRGGGRDNADLRAAAKYCVLLLTNSAEVQLTTVDKATLMEIRDRLVFFLQSNIRPKWASLAVDYVQSGHQRSLLESEKEQLVAQLAKLRGELGSEGHHVGGQLHEGLQKHKDVLAENQALEHELLQLRADYRHNVQLNESLGFTADRVVRNDPLHCTMQERVAEKEASIQREISCLYAALGEGERVRDTSVAKGASLQAHLEEVCKEKGEACEYLAVHKTTTAERDSLQRNRETFREQVQTESALRYKLMTHANELEDQLSQAQARIKSCNEHAETAERELAQAEEENRRAKTSNEGLPHLVHGELSCVCDLQAAVRTAQDEKDSLRTLIAADKANWRRTVLITGDDAQETLQSEPKHNAKFGEFGGVGFELLCLITVIVALCSRVAVWQ